MLKSSMKEAVALLGRRGGFIRMIISGILLLFASVLPIMTGSYVTSAIFCDVEISWRHYPIIFGIAAVLFILLTLPVLGVFMRSSWDAYLESKQGYAPGRKKGRYGYFRNMLSAALLFLRQTVVAVVFCVTYLLAKRLSEILVFTEVRVPMIAMLVPLWLFAIVISVIFMLATDGMFYAPYLYGSGESAGKAIRKSRKMAKKSRRVRWLFSFAFLGMSLLSLLTVGVLFVFGVMPLMMYTYLSLAEKIDSEN